MYESRKRPPLLCARFCRRFALHLTAAIGCLSLFLLLIGITGYGCFESPAWRDVFDHDRRVMEGMDGSVEANGASVFASEQTRPDIARSVAFQGWGTSFTLKGARLIPSIRCVFQGCELRSWRSLASDAACDAVVQT